MSHRNHRIIYTTVDKKSALGLAECYYDKSQETPRTRTEEFEHIGVGDTTEQMLASIKDILEQQLEIIDTAGNDISLLQNNPNFIEFLDDKDLDSERIKSAQKNLKWKLAEVLKVQQDHTRILKDEDFLDDEEIDWEKLAEEEEEDF